MRDHFPPHRQASREDARQMVSQSLTTSGGAGRGAVPPAPGRPPFREGR
ncbi:hypothetical protein CSE45_4344 [Citreicella sp. SE45]|nr:hypothetical protein CSE45_4344 [Citreicella sp. SE45]